MIFSRVRYNAHAIFATIEEAREIWLRGFHERVPIASVKTDVTKSPPPSKPPPSPLPPEQKEAGRRESSESREIYIYIYIGVEGTKVCIESRNANASNIDTASPFERSLNLSRHSSHPFLCSARAANPNTAVRAHATPVRSRTGRYTRAPRKSGWRVEGPLFPLSQSIGCAEL